MIEIFGELPSGQKVERVTITNGRLSASIITLGASLQDLRLAGHEPSLVLGFPDFEPYLTHAYFGAMAGRVANRISNAGFNLDGKSWSMEPNFLGKHMLHGGSKGIAHQNWKIIEHSDISVTLETVDQFSQTGFPGDCTITCTYSIVDASFLRIDISASTTEATPCNIAHHSYFNLEGSGSILDHALKINAGNYLPVDHELIPTGEIAPVVNTGFDFSHARSINSGKLIAIDHNFCIADGQQALSEIAIIEAPHSKVALKLWSTEPGLQVYTGENIHSDVPGHGGQILGAHAGIALEPQNWPDAVNRPNFPNSVIGPGQTYRQTSLFAFSKNS